MLGLGNLSNINPSILTCKVKHLLSDEVVAATCIALLCCIVFPEVSGVASYHFIRDVSRVAGHLCTCKVWT